MVNKNEIKALKALVAKWRIMADADRKAYPLSFYSEGTYDAWRSAADDLETLLMVTEVT